MGNLYSQNSDSAQYPFPEAKQYSFGKMSTKITSDDAWDAYVRWKEKFVEACGENEVRIKKSQPQITVSEGIGYGAAIVVYAGDKELFDKLLNYHIARRNKNGMMNWYYENCETGDNKKNGATDAEMDLGIALVVATKQWPHDVRYKNEANKIIDSMQVHYFTMFEGVIIQKPGDEFGGSNCLNPSYFSPAYYRVFAEFKKEQNEVKKADFWTKAASDSYITLLKNAHKETGLVYAWTNAEGGDPKECYYEVTGSGVYNSYQYDACRTPWRIANDYLWFGTEDAKLWTQKITKFVNAPIYAQYGKTGNVWYGAGGIENVVDNYWHNGLRRINPEGHGYGHRHTVPFVGSFALASMSGTQEIVDLSMADFNAIKTDGYYESCLEVLYKFLATGNFWNPYNKNE